MEAIVRSKIPFALLFWGTLSLSFILLPSCANPAKPEESQRLIIENGYYSKCPTTDSSKIKYVVEFVYYVTVEKCKWGGYAVQMDSQAHILSLYIMQTLNPDVRYTRSDTFRVSGQLKTPPIIKMQGYKIGSSESYDELYAEFVLQPKL